MRRMLFAASLALMSILAAQATAAEAPKVSDSSFVLPDGARVLQESILVNAPPAKVWKAFTDEATIRAWNAPLVHIDLRNGGLIEEGFDHNAKLGGNETIRHQVIAFLPERLLVLRNISTPPGPPSAALYPSIVQIVSLEPVGETATRVTLSGSGYGSGAGYDALYSFFQEHNAEYLVDLKALCEKAPVAP